jgi:DNA-binding SARP family transcriptional activator
VEIQLLGAVQARCGDHQINIGPRKQRLVLAALALRANKIVPLTHLVALTWPDQPPPSAHHAIHVRLSRLRLEIAEAQRNGRSRAEIVTHGANYVLNIDPLNIDAHRFKAMVVQSRMMDDNVEKAELLRESLALWRGPALADVTTPDISETLCRGLEEMRLAAAEEWLEVEMHLGRHNAILDELIEFAVEHPYRQRLLFQLMLALYRAGRAPEALLVYQRARRLYVDQLGLDPAQALQQLENAILRADPALDLNGHRANHNGHTPRVEDLTLWKY